MPTDPITFASLLDPAGAIIAAGLVSTFAQIVKTYTGWAGVWIAGAASAVLYILAAIATGVSTLDAGLTVFLSWMACAASATGLHSTVRYAQSRGQ